MSGTNKAVDTPANSGELERETPEDNLQRVVDILAHHGGMLAGALGYELWGRVPCGRTDNTAATMYCRPAGKLLKCAKALGLVRDVQKGPQHLWYANKETNEDC